MDDYDIIIMDEDDDPRNAVRDRRRRHHVRRRPGSGWSRRPTRVIRTPRTGGSQTVVVEDGGVLEGPSRTVIAGLTIGELLESATQVLAAIQPLPAPPVATGEGGLDVENLVLYQTALAQHAKRDEQIRTLGSIVAKLIE